MDPQRPHSRGHQSPWKQLMDPANPDQFKTHAEMEAIFAGIGLKKTDTIIVYCGSSRDATWSSWCCAISLVMRTYACTRAPGRNIVPTRRCP